MTKMSYAEQLKHPNWQRLRLEKLSAANWECESCCAKDVTLHVHHSQYFKGRKAWEYELHELVALCETCHEDEHVAEEVLKRLLMVPVGYGVSNTRLAIGLLGGYLLSSYDLDASLETDCKRVAGGALLDVGSAAFCIAVSPRAKASEALASLVDGQPSDPVTANLLERWAATRLPDA